MEVLSKEIDCLDELRPETWEDVRTSQAHRHKQTVNDSNDCEDAKQTERLNGLVPTREQERANIQEKSQQFAIFEDKEESTHSKSENVVDQLLGETKNRTTAKEQLLQEYQKGGMYQQLAILTYIAEHQGQSTAQSSDARNVQRMGYTKTDILDKFSDFSLRFTDLIENDNQNNRKKLYKVDMQGGIELVLKIEEFPGQDTRKLRAMRREYYIGRTLGGISEFIAHTYDWREVKMENGDIRTEIIMEYGGLPLSKSEAHLNYDTIILFAYQLSSILALMENEGVAHMDLKPLNILWNPNTKNIKLIDFGASMAFKANPTRILQPLGKDSERFSGFTRYYAPPEVLKIERGQTIVQSVIPQKIDAYCFGVTLLELLHKISNRRDCLEQTTSHVEYINKVCNRVRELNACALKDILTSCLQDDLKARPTFREIQSALANIVQASLSRRIPDAYPLRLDEYWRFARFYAQNHEPDISVFYYQKALQMAQTGSPDPLASPSNNMGLLSSLENRRVSSTADATHISLQRKGMPNSARSISSDMILMAILHHMGIEYHKLGHYTIAEECFKKSGKMMDINADINIAVFCQTGNIHLSKGNYLDALHDYQTAERIAINTYGAHYPGLCHIYLNIGNVYSRQQQPNIALEYFQKARELIKFTHNANYVSAADVYTAMGIAYHKLGQYETALDYYQQAEQVILNEYGQYHTDMVYILVNIAIAYCASGEYTAALEYCDRTEKILVAAYGDDHIDIAAIWCIRGTIYFRLNDYAKADGSYTNALHIRTEILGPTHSSLAEIYNNIGSIYYKKGDYTQALEGFLKAESKITSECGEAHLDLADIRSNTGNAYFQLGQYQEALDYYQKAALIFRKADRTNAVSLATIYYCIGFAYATLRDYSTALEYYKKAESILVVKEQIGSLTLSHLYLYMGALYARIDKHSTALEYFKQAEPGLASKNYNKRSELCYLHCEMADAYLQQGEYETALWYYHKAKPIVTADCRNHPRRLGNLFCSMGSAYQRLKNYPTALKYYKKAKAPRRRNSETTCSFPLSVYR